MRRVIGPVAGAVLCLLAGVGVAFGQAQPRPVPAEPAQPRVAPGEPAQPRVAPGEPARAPTVPDAPTSPIIDVTVPAMTFRLVEGQGVFGVTRWVQASGRIVRDTPQAFAAFLRSVPAGLEGVPVYLDSSGGHLRGGLELGRAIRQARLETAVGRTFTRVDSGRADDTLVTHAIGCHSACAYALLGGVERRIASTARIGVHQFSQRVDAAGRPVDSGFGMSEFTGAQELVAALAVYLQDMGVDARLLEVAATVPFGQPLRILTAREIADLRVGRVSVVAQAEREAVGWSLHQAGDRPMLYRLVTRPVVNGRRIDEELYIACGTEAGQYTVMLRQVVAVLADRGDELRMIGARVSAGRLSAVWRRPEDQQPLRAGNVNGSVWATFIVRRDLMEAAQGLGELRVSVAGGAAFEPATDHGEGFSLAYAALAEGCAARAAVRPALRVVPGGAPPRPADPGPQPPSRLAPPTQDAPLTLPR